MTLTARRRTLRNASVVNLFCMVPVLDATGNPSGWLTSQSLGTLDRSRPRNTPDAPWHAAAHHWIRGTGVQPSHAADIQGAMSLCDSVADGVLLIAQLPTDRVPTFLCLAPQSSPPIEFRFQTTIQWRPVV